MFVEELKNVSEWEDFLKGTSGGTFYHSIKWRDVLERSFSYPSVYAVIRSENGGLVGICPMSIVTSSHFKILDSLPHSDFGGPVIEEKYIGEASFALQRFIEGFSRKEGISFAKLCFLGDESVRFFKTSRCYINDCKGVVELDLKTKPSVFIWEKIFRANLRKKIKRFEHDGFQVREASTRSDLRDFLVLYYQNMRHIGTPGYASTFFENVWNLLHPENFSILLAEKREPIGGIAVFKYGQKIYGAYVGMDRTSLSARYSVFPFLGWEAIRWAEENGYTRFCFGSTPALPESVSAIANYSQKVAFGGSFLQQETLMIPFDFRTFAIFLLRSKTVKAQKAVKSILPSRFQKAIARMIGGVF